MGAEADSRKIQLNDGFGSLLPTYPSASAMGAEADR